MSSLVKSATIVMICTIITKVLGFVRELTLAFMYGASSYSDAYLTANNISLVLFAGLGGALATTFIPMYNEVARKNNDESTNLFVNNIFNILILLSVLLSVVFIIFAKPIVKLFAIGFDGEILNITVQFTRILIFGAMFVVLSNMATAYLQIKENFMIPALSTIPSNIIIIISIIVSAKYGIYFMVFGALLGMLMQFIFQIPYVIKKEYKYQPYINFKDSYIKKMLWLIMPVFIGTTVNQVNTMVDRTIASTLSEGSISALNYANKLNSFIMTLFITSIASVIYPMLSKLSVEDNKKEFKNTIVKSINTIIILMIPITVGAIVLSTPIIKLLFQRGEFDSNATNMTSTALVMYSIGMVAFGLRDILGKIFYSLQDTKTPMINGGIAVIMNIVLNFILVKHMKLAGIALATSLSSILCIMLLFKSLYNKIEDFGQKKITLTLIKVSISAIIMGLITKYTYSYLSINIGIGLIYDVISLSLSIFVGFIVYFFVIVLLKVDEIKMIENKFRSILTTFSVKNYKIKI